MLPHYFGDTFSQQKNLLIRKYEARIELWLYSQVLDKEHRSGEG